MITTLAIATANPGKQREFTQLLRGTGIQTYEGPPLEYPPETGRDYFENALIKARFAAQEWEIPVVAEDSGLEVNGLRNLPGIWSARFASFDPAAIVAALETGDLSNAPPASARHGRPVSSDENNDLLLRLTRQMNGDQRACRYVASLVLVDAAGNLLYHTQACVGGRLLEVPRGINGFGYDPIVALCDHPDLAVAQLSADEKNAVSHRGQVMRNLLAWLERQHEA